MNNNSGFFEKIENVKPFVKFGFRGFAGDGKTHTAALVAIGLHRRIGSTKPVVIFDTETSSKFLKPMFDSAGIEVLVKRSRSLSDLKGTFKACIEDGISDILIIDSITHIWENFIEAYKAQKKYNKTFLEFQDWGKIKPLWKQEFSTPFVELPLHILMTGRAGYEYDNEVDENTKKVKDIFKSGVKMKAESETGHEPDYLIHMERIENILDGKKEIYREATVIKDRSNILDGCVFKNPTYEDFSKMIEPALEGHYKVAPASRNAGELIVEEERRESDKTEIAICLEEIKGLLLKYHPSRKEEDVKAKTELLFNIFNTRSWTYIEGLNLGMLQRGLSMLRDTLGEPEPEIHHEMDLDKKAEEVFAN